MLRTLILPLALVTCTLLQAQELLQRSYHPNGTLHRTRFSDGAVEYFMEYHANGRLSAMGAFRDGLRHGTWKVFDGSGVMRARAEFDRGRRCGHWEFRDERDRLRGSLQYVDGRLISGSSSDPEAGLTAHRSY
jgi:antitoxin component YwqK of YwqJK toxin-antitoxin module